MARSLPLALAIALASCGEQRAVPDAGGPVRDRGGSAEVGGRVVSTVDGAPITIEEIEDVARATGLTPEQALRRLQEERVLAQRGERAGLGSADEVRAEARRAAVRALLEERVEGEVGPEDVPAERVAAAYEEQRARFQRPERRRSMHVLARVPRDAPPEVVAQAERFARRAAERLAHAADPVAEGSAIQGETTGRTFEVVSESLPPVARTDPFAPEYLAAIFGAPSTGAIAEPVRTQFGVHAIVVLEILPPWEAPREEAEEVLRGEILAELRAQRLDALVQELAARTPVVLDEAAIDRAMRADLEPSR